MTIAKLARDIKEKKQFFDLCKNYANPYISNYYIRLTFKVRNTKEIQI